MLKFSRMNFAGAMLFGMLIVINNVNAAGAEECTTSLATSDAYYDTDLNKTLSSKEKKALNAFSQHLIGEWGGDYTEIQCSGSKDNPKKTYKLANITDAIIENYEKDDGLKIEAEFKYKRRVLTYKSELLSSENISIFEFSGKNNLIIGYKWWKFIGSGRVGRGGGSTKIIERIYAIELNKNAIKMTIFNYANGFLDSEEQINLSKN